MCLEGCFFSEFSFPTLDGWLFTFKYEIVPLLPNLPCCHVPNMRYFWFYAREIDYGGDFLDKATYGEI
jgi:hypothetical protein